MSWYKHLVSQQLNLFGDPNPKKKEYDPVPYVPQNESTIPEKIEPQKSKPGLNVFVESANSYGDMTLYINNKKYTYRLPWSAREIGDQLTDYQRKGWGKQIRRIITRLDKYRIQT